MKKLLPLILGAIAIITITGYLYQEKIKIPVIFKDADQENEINVVLINDKKINVEVARTNEERHKGLGGRESLGENNGMLFVFVDSNGNSNSTPTFWMKDTLIPLDFIWVRGGKITKIDKNVQPEPGVSNTYLKRYPAPNIVDYVIEVNAGYSDKLNIKEGDLVTIKI